VFPDLPMTVERSANGAISFEGSFFAVNYVGTISGDEFVASGSQSLPGAAGQCRDGTPYAQLTGTSVLAGRFVAGKTQITATETNVYRLDSGEAVTYVWSWAATRNQAPSANSGRTF
jgi:hypothetical protein